MTAIISEFHSVTYQCKSSLHISEINIRKNNGMAPQQHDAVPKSTDMETKDPLNSSPVSNIGTSVDSSPPQTSNKAEAENMNEYEMEQARAFDPSSEDSGSMSSMADQDEFHQSPLEQLQYTFGKNGLLPQKSPLSSYSSEKMRSSLPADMREFRDIFPSPPVGIYNRNVSPASAGMFSRTMTSTPVGMFERNMPSTSAGIFSRDVTTSSAAMFNGEVQTSPAGIFARDISSSSPMFNRNIPSTSAGVSDRDSPLDIYSKNIPCHLCDFVSASKEEHDAHMNEHFEYKCTQCTYASRTEGRLKRHIKDFHSDTPPESWSGSKIRKKSRSNSVESMENCVTSSNGKSRQFKCKHCDFICSTKNDFWSHAKTHMKPDKILQCPHCEFASEFKHHYEYHIANHFGRKPFKCSMCNYKCVNKSMLNSHMKSHSNVYQFRCATCSYVTKYCHSIKQHLKTKQGHEAGPILNQDGSPSTIQMIDVYGRRRGPRAKKRKGSENLSNSASSSVSTNQQVMPYSTSVSMLPAAMYPSMEYASNFFMGGTHQLNPAYSMHIPLPNVQFGRYECTVCRHATNDLESLNRHIMTHAGDYPDIAKLYGINPKIVQNPQAYRDAISQRNYLEHAESNIESSVSPRNEKVSSSNVISSDGKQESVEGILDARSIKSEERSSPDYRQHSSSSPRNGESCKEFSSPSPAHSPASLNDYLAKKHDMAVSVVRTSETLSMEVESCRQPSGNDTPIDLSSPKSDSPKSDKSKDAVIEHQPSDFKCVSPRNMESTNVTTTNRHRRKGKAFKLDHYMQYNEAQEMVKRESGDVQLIGSYKDETMEDIEQLWAGKPEQKKECVVSEKYSKSEIQKPDTSDQHYSDPHEPTKSQNSYKMMAVQSANILNGNHKFPNCTNLDSQHESVISNETRSQSEPSTMLVKVDEKDISSQPTRYECQYCATAFGDWFIYSVHMGFHGPQDPFTCKSCGCVTKDATQFFIHLVRESH